MTPALALLRLPLLIAFGVAAAGAAHAQKYKTQYGTIAPTVVSVSLVELLVNGDKFDGKVVRVSGVLNLQFEGDALYLSKEHFAHRITRNALWVSPDYIRLRSDPAQLSKLNGRYVLVEGRFESKIKGHMGLFSGAIENVNRVMLLED